MERKNEFLAELESGNITMLLLARIKFLNESNSPTDEPYTQALLKFVNEQAGAKSSTCFSRLRSLRLTKHITEYQGKYGNKGIIGYRITTEGERLLSELIKRSKELCKISEDLTNGIY